MYIIFFLGWKSRDSVPKLVDEYLNKKIMLDEFVSHNMPFEKINEAFDLMHAGKRFVDVLVHKRYMEILLTKVKTSK
jgi:S-(hydroxymethyl)glutathione dehydrogenase/alcohol dehydrogenase